MAGDQKGRASQSSAPTHQIWGRIKLKKGGYIPNINNKNYNSRDPQL
jgi:hypothetical protein